MDTNTILAVVIIGGALFYAFRPAAKASATKPGRRLIDSFHEAGKECAGEIVEKVLGEAEAQEIMQRMNKAFASRSDPPTPTPAGSSPAPTVPPKSAT